MCLQIKNYKNKDMVFMEDGMNVENALQMCPSGREEGPMAVVMDEFCVDDGEKCDLQI